MQTHMSISVACPAPFIRTEYATYGYAHHVGGKRRSNAKLAQGPSDDLKDDGKEDQHHKADVR
jgi:hypothetical protein